MRATAAFRLATILAVLAVGVDSSDAFADAPRIHTGKARFRIPFRSSEEEIRRLGSREVRLFVSTNGGRDWQHVQSVRPETQRFDFEADGDGEYRFAVRTVDASGGLHPAGPVEEAGLVVIVDTRPPRFEVRLRELEPGRVELHWRIADEHVDPTTLRLEYVQPGLDGWQPVSVVPRAEGRTTWSTPRGGRVAVRGTVADHASNVARAQHQIEVAPAGDRVPKSSVPDFRQPIAEGSESMPPRFPEDFEIDDRTAGRLPEIEPEGASGGAASDDDGFGEEIDGRLIADDPGRRPDVLQGRYPRPSRADEWIGDDQRPNQRLVRSLEFAVDYEVADVGPSGLGAVEFYITTDEGRTWYRYGEDEDLQTPFPVRVPQEGTYGFAMRARSGVGLATDPPQPGERPAITVTVDRTPPKIRLAPPQQGSGERVNELVLHWRVEEPHPAENAVSLSYAADPAGPWTPITDWRPDDGRYTWRLGPDVPSRLYVRLEVRDAAGNVARAETPEPVLVDLARPKARIVDVQPVAPR